MNKILTNKKTKRPFPVNGWSPQLPFNTENISKVPDKAGVYAYFDSGQKPIYVGVSKNGDASGLRHRIQSYNEKDDFNEHPTKKALRPHIHSFRYKVVSIKEARQIEKNMKQGTKYNADNKINEAKK